MQRPLFLIGNDDGLGWPGLDALVAVAREFDVDVVVAAPEQHQSGMASAITIVTPLRASLVHDEPGYKVYSINGTPADCAKLALTHLVDREPTLLLSGINHGYNSGVNTLYSGTMGVAFEGAVHRVPAIAFSYGDYKRASDMEPCKPWLRRVIQYALDHPMTPGTCWNVNIPFEYGEIKGMRVTKADTGRWYDEFKAMEDAIGRTVYWMTGNYCVADENDLDTDMAWLSRGYVSIVPCKVDQTAFDEIGGISALSCDA